MVSRLRELTLSVLLIYVSSVVCFIGVEKLRKAGLGFQGFWKTLDSRKSLRSD